MSGNSERESAIRNLFLTAHRSNARRITRSHEHPTQTSRFDIDRLSGAVVLPGHSSWNPCLPCSDPASGSALPMPCSRTTNIMSGLLTPHRLHCRNEVHEITERVTRIREPQRLFVEIAHRGRAT